CVCPFFAHYLHRSAQSIPSTAIISTTKTQVLQLSHAGLYHESRGQRMPAYGRGLYYPVKLGDVFHSRYQVLSKLGFGANLTVWFCCDLEQHGYIALKIYISSPQANQEVRVLEHLSKIKTDHPSSSLVRKIIEEFELTGPSAYCLRAAIIESLHFQATLDPTSLPEDLLKGALQQLLLALDFLHSEAHIIHTAL
ncbi:hypothetical protein GB937_007034, partial [Aspergillus fischeri]